MIRQLSKHEMIREAQDVLGKDASNKQIKQYCNDNFGVTPISQTIYSAIGSEFSRSAESISAKELCDSKKFVKKTFNGDRDKAHLAIDLVGRFR
tara:strand:+ start:216 stop:497 length:282 start_codon:yes stop_codon:yes gene_type:complete